VRCDFEGERVTDETRERESNKNGLTVISRTTGNQNVLAFRGRVDFVDLMVDTLVNGCLYPARTWNTCL
jgi:hypothetical protein